MVRPIVASLLLAVTAACAQLPKAELQAYSEAVQAARSAAEPIVADYAIAERGQRLRVMQADSARAYDAFFPSFRTSDAPALSTLSLPPGAAAVDRGLRAISNYTDTLVALAANRNIGEARGQLTQMLDDLGGITPQTTAAATAIKPVADLLITALSPAIEADNRQQFRRIVLDGYPHVDALIGVLRDHTPAQFSTTTSALQRAVRADPPPTNRDELIDRINGWHRAYADYVALLDITDQRLSELHAAVEHPRSVPLLQRASAGAAELRAYAEALRLSLAQLRAQP